jgi:hypothetical protein
VPSCPKETPSPDCVTSSARSTPIKILQLFFGCSPLLVQASPSCGQMKNDPHRRNHATSHRQNPAFKTRAARPARKHLASHCHQQAAHLEMPNVRHAKLDLTQQLPTNRSRFARRRVEYDLDFTRPKIVLAPHQHLTGLGRSVAENEVVLNRFSANDSPKVYTPTHGTPAE